MPDIAPQNLPTGGKSFLEDKDPPAASSVPVPAALVAPAKVPVPPKPPTVSAPAAPTPRPAMPAPLPAPKVDDIFSDLKEAPVVPPSPMMTKRQFAAPASAVAETVVETPKQGFKKIIITTLGILIGVGLLGAGGYFAFIKLIKPKPLSPSLNLNAEQRPVQQPAVQPVQQPAVQQPVVRDSDNDGLTDDQEAALSTDPAKPDTDGDLLFDGEEVNVYKTDPLNFDTDGDSFKDGDEVRSGYDPKGPGKLIKIPAQ
jgi:hypothetical protein